MQQLMPETKKSILIVEDEGLIAADLQVRLERMGYSVPGIAHSGAEAIRSVEAAPPDLVLMDIRIAGDMDGIATAQALWNEFQIPVVYMTAHSDPETVERAALTEPFGYVLKPVADGALRSAVQVALYKSEMEGRLRASEFWLSATLRSVGEGIVATGTTGEIVFMNPVAEQFTGWHSEDARGHQLMDVLTLLAEADAQPAKNPVFDLLPGEERTYILVSSTGHRRFVEIACFENGLDNRDTRDILGAIVVVRDIEARKQLQARLVQSQRMEAIAAMAGGLAHDFNNQLMVIQGYTEELCTRLSGMNREDALAVRQAASVAASISNQLLALSRRDVVRPEVLNSHEVISEILPVLNHSLGRGHTLASELGSHAGFIRIDRNLLKQVLVNLTLHARDTMPAAGCARLESAAIEIEAGSPEARLNQPGLYVRIRFTVSGEELDQAALSRIFEPFAIKSSGHGTGLGLSIAHSIVIQSGGSITASSVKERGTSFEILLPSIGAFHGIAEVRGGCGRAARDIVPTLLLVEDEDSVRRLVRGYLEGAGYQLLEARNAEDAELIAKVYREPIHLLVTDVVMPGMTGSELAERLAPLRPLMKVLLISGYRHDTLERHGLDRDETVLAKPFPAPELLRRVRALLGREANAE